MEREKKTQAMKWPAVVRLLWMNWRAPKHAAAMGFFVLPLDRWTWPFLRHDTGMCRYFDLIFAIFYRIHSVRISLCFLSCSLFHSFVHCSLFSTHALKYSIPLLIASIWFHFYLLPKQWRTCVIFRFCSSFVILFFWLTINWCESIEMECIIDSLNLANDLFDSMSFVPFTFQRTPSRHWRVDVYETETNFHHFGPK